MPEIVAELALFLIFDPGHDTWVGKLAKINLRHNPVRNTANGGNVKAKDVKFLVVHCADTPPDMDIGAKEIDQWHRGRGWDGIGYHLVIRRDGTVEFGRPFDKVGAHVKGHNDESIGICLVGGREGYESPLLPGLQVATDKLYTREQARSLGSALEFLLACFPSATVVGHNQLTDAKTCPNFDVPSWWVDWRARRGTEW